ncbi:ATP synthase B/B' CF family protein [Orientia chuto str. Dubai]|uniref:ATP synthase B/B' CF family protein n=1 Tax=Orientia chuto str. Dubai TaxID=1359168 RepID=A0A0F3MIX2_9RICK|nr:ATP synthase F0 subunit B [Candidatus Orientia mediorientalis]KJV55713.1 ATP synthase B/B' CF family protein [Orientia chuto str. Dubai]
MLIYFILFIIISYKPFKKFLTNTLDNKIKSIKDRIDHSIAINDNAEEMLIEAKTKLIEAKNKKTTLLAQAQKAANNIAALKLNDLEIKIKEYEMQVQERIKYEKHRAIEEMYAYFFKISSKIALKYISDTLQNSDTNIIISMIDNNKHDESNSICNSPYQR